ncbi:MAG: transglycosylase domain-containing protein [Bosea sp.]|nr:transglycosylase domain-containing protein [Bosea sp. (in: a-proteobacteria)]
MKVAAAAFAAAALAGTAALALYIRSLPPLDLSAASNRSTVVLDREGKLLRPFLTADGRWKLPVTSDDVDPRYLAMLKAYEDKRFDSHHGIDPLGLARAAGQMLRHGRVVSGGSTLTMQVARLLEPRDERNLAAKLRQAVRAVELEQRFGKKEILDLYLNLAPFGGNLEGVRAASFAYFGKEPKRLSTAEAALLVALPQSPETRRPDRFAEAARKARARVLARVERAGIATASEVAAAREEEIPTARRPAPCARRQPRPCPHRRRRCRCRTRRRGDRRRRLLRQQDQSATGADRQAPRRSVGPAAGRAVRQDQRTGRSRGARLAAGRHAARTGRSRRRQRRRRRPARRALYRGAGRAAAAAHRPRPRLLAAR